MPKTLTIVLPKVRRGAAGRCTANDLSATARAHIALRYADDLRLYAERCDAEALVKARADAPKGVEPIPAPYTWVQSGYVTGASAYLGLYRLPCRVWLVKCLLLVKRRIKPTCPAFSRVVWR